ncbi:uncharacterized protein LOC122143866 [Cyprinus carpio]|uniref:Uncharacterized protein LOC122143866 n=1 Tax=Cyprinus carpio TaxID=7962 RepID=A0A9R0AT66_CYPCA|nr:uncharacterized protein LOC122143866 [Cyprinus carpio]
MGSGAASATIEDEEKGWGQREGTRLTIPRSLSQVETLLDEWIEKTGYLPGEDLILDLCVELLQETGRPQVVARVRNSIEKSAVELLPWRREESKREASAPCAEGSNTQIISSLNREKTIQKVRLRIPAGRSPLTSASAYYFSALKNSVVYEPPLQEKKMQRRLTTQQALEMILSEVNPCDSDGEDIELQPDSDSELSYLSSDEETAPQPKKRARLGTDLTETAKDGTVWCEEQVGTRLPFTPIKACLLTLTAYAPKRKKTVYILSSMHSVIQTDNTTKRKPNTVTLYNTTKCGVDVMDQMVREYTVRTGTRR